MSSFGGEQFILPEQQHHLQTFFSLFYAAINCGSLISVLLTPILRSNIACFGQDSCYPLAFGVPAALMVSAVCKSMYCILAHAITMQCMGKVATDHLVISIFNIFFALLVLFMAGRLFGLYKMWTPEENIIIKTSACLWVI